MAKNRNTHYHKGIRKTTRRFGAYADLDPSSIARWHLIDTEFPGIDENGYADITVQNNGNEVGLDRILNFIPGSGINLYITSTGSTDTLNITIESQVALSTGTNIVKVTKYDTTPRPLDDKIAEGDGIVTTVLSPGGDEDLEIKTNIDLQTGLKFDASTPKKLQVSLESDAGIQFDAVNYGLELKLDGSTLITSGSGLKISSGGVTSTEILTNAVTPFKLDAFNEPQNDYFPAYDSATQQFEWKDVPAGSDEKIKITSNDTTADYLYNKTAEGDGIRLIETKDGGNEDLEIRAKIGDGLEFTSTGTPETIQVDAGDGLEFGSSLQVNVTDIIDTATGLTETDNNIQINYANGITVDTGQLIINLDGSTLSQSGSGLSISSGGVTSTEILTNAITPFKLDAFNEPVNTYVPSYDSTTQQFEWIEVAAGSDEKIKITSNDTTAGYLDGKVAEGDGIVTTELNDGSDEDLEIRTKIDQSTGLKFSSTGSPESIQINVGDGLDATPLSVDVTDIIDTNYGLTENTNNIRINLDNTDGCLEFDSGELAIVQGDGIDTSPNKLTARIGDGLEFTSTGSPETIQVSLESSGGLDFTNGQVGVDVTDIIDTNYGLTESSNKIRVDIDNNTLEFETGILHISSGGVTSTEILTNAVTPFKLDAFNEPQNDYFPAYDSATQQFEWVEVVAGSDEHVKITSNDTTAGYLDGKVVEGDGIVTTVLNPSGDEDLEIRVKINESAGLEWTSTGSPEAISVNLDSDSGMQFDDGAIQVNLDPNGGLAFGLGDVGAIAINVDSSTVGINVSNELEVSDGGITETQINTSVAGDGLTGGGGSALAVGEDDGVVADVNSIRAKIDQSTGLKFSSTGSPESIQINVGDGLVVSSALDVNVTEIIDTSYGLTENSNNIRVNLDTTDGGLDFDTGAISLQLTTNSGLVVDANKLGIDLDGSTLSLGASGISISSGGVTSTEILTDAVTPQKLDGYNEPSDRYVPQYRSASQEFNWRPMDYHVYSKNINWDDSSPVTIVTAQDGWVIVDVWAEITTQWTGLGADLSVGDPSDADGFLTATTIDAGTVGYYGYEADGRGAYLWDDTNNHIRQKIYTSSTAVNIYKIGTPSAGAATVYIGVIHLK